MSASQVFKILALFSFVTILKDNVITNVHVIYCVTVYYDVP